MWTRETQTTCCLNMHVVVNISRARPCLVSASLRSQHSRLHAESAELATSRCQRSLKCVQRGRAARARFLRVSYFLQDLWHTMTMQADKMVRVKCICRANVGTRNTKKMLEYACRCEYLASSSVFGFSKLERPRFWIACRVSGFGHSKMPTIA